MEKRHKHVSPTLDIMDKKILSLPEVTVAFRWHLFEIFWIWMLWMPRFWREHSFIKRTLMRMSSFQPRWMFELSLMMELRLLLRFGCVSNLIFSIVFIIIWPTRWWKMCNNYANKAHTQDVRADGASLWHSYLGEDLVVG